MRPRCATRDIDVPILSWLNPSGVDAARAAADRVDIAVGSVEELRQLVADAVGAGARAPTYRHRHVARRVPLSRTGRSCSTAARAAAGPHRGRRGDGPSAAGRRRRSCARTPPRCCGCGRRGMPCCARASVRCSCTSPRPPARSPTPRRTSIWCGWARDSSASTRRRPWRWHGASRLTASVVHSALVPRGHGVGYGGTFVTAAGDAPQRDRRRVCRRHPARAVGGGGRRDRRESRHPIVGRVSMDQIVVDTGEPSVPRGDDRDGVRTGGRGGAVSVQEWARWAGTIPHTIVTGIGARVQRSIA